MTRWDKIWLIVSSAILFFDVCLFIWIENPGRFTMVATTVLAALWGSEMGKYLRERRIRKLRERLERATKTF